MTSRDASGPPRRRWRPCLVAGAGAARTGGRVHALHATKASRGSVGVLRCGRPAHRPAVADRLLPGRGRAPRPAACDGGARLRRDALSLQARHGRALNSWAADFAGRTPDCLHTATFFPEADASGYVAEALAAGARVAKAHLQVGAYDPRHPLLDPVWGQLADARVPVVVHCGSYPVPGPATGPAPMAEVLARHPGLVLVRSRARLRSSGRARVRRVPRPGGGAPGGVPGHHHGLHAVPVRGGALSAGAAPAPGGATAQDPAGLGLPPVSRIPAPTNWPRSSTSGSATPGYTRSCGPTPPASSAWVCPVTLRRDEFLRPASSSH